MTNVLILLTLPEDVRVQYQNRLKAAYPELTVNLVDRHDKVGPYIGDADILITFGPMLADHVLAEGRRIKWIQALGTGVDNLIDLPSLRPDIIITNCHGIHGAAVSEAAFASMLALSRRLHHSVRAQDRREWARWPSALLDGKTVGILGVGAIAEALAPRCKAFGMRVVGISSGVREVAGFDEMRRRLDHLVLLTPLSEATRNIVDKAVLDAMKPTAFLTNLARGGVVDEAALAETLTARKIAGAAIDVFVTEPLPADHPFWALDNTILTPHLGGFNDQYVNHAMPIIEANMAAYLAGARDKMVNVVQNG